MTEVELMQRLRADAVLDLERVKVLAGILPFTYLERLDQRAAALSGMIRQYDDALAGNPMKQNDAPKGGALVLHNPQWRLSHKIPYSYSGT
jgi:hypothetical protein